MTKNELFALTGLPGVIDYAIPQPWYDAVSKVTGRNPIHDYVWYYAPDSLCGRAMSIGEMYALAMENNRLFTQEQMRYEIDAACQEVEQATRESMLSYPAEPNRSL